MTFYQQFPAIYAYPMPFPNQDFYMYPPGSTVGEGPIYFDHNSQSMGTSGLHGKGGMNGGSHFTGHKQGYNNRKDSADSGISDYSVMSSRKTSNTSTISNTSIIEETHLDDVAEETPFEEPDDELCEKIVQQVEFYFSDANITKDKFLLKHVKRNKEGFVSLKLISSFKRVKHLTKDWRQVAFAIERKSDRLEVNDIKTKVRRLESLPEYDETTPSRTVVALNLPLERPTIEAVAEIFSACGDIVLIRILRPGNPVPADIKPFANKHPEMTAKVCALVEFERTEFAHKAVRDLDNQEEEDKMKVMELTAPPPKSTKKDALKKSIKLQQQFQQQQQFVFQQQQQQQGGPQRRFSHAGFHLPQQQNPNQMVLGPRRRISLMHNMKFSPISEEDQQKKEQFSLNPNAPTFQMQQQQQNYQMQQQMQQQRRLSRPTFMHPSAAAAAVVAMEAAAMQQQLQFQPSPWMIRRLSSINPQGDFSTSGLTLPPNVVRMPRGPDKGKGFQKWCRNRMETGPRIPGSHAVPIVAPPSEDEEKTEDVINISEAAEEVEGAAAAAVVAAAEVVTPRPVPAIIVEEPAVAPIVAVAVADSCSDSGNEDCSLSEHDLEAVDNERSR